MSNLLNLANDLANESDDNLNRKKIEKLSTNVVPELISHSDYVGEVTFMDYKEVRVQIQNDNRNNVGGIALNAFLLATKNITNIKEGNEYILLRVVSDLPVGEVQVINKIIYEGVLKNKVDTPDWDTQITDPNLKSILSVGGLLCKVIGTFYVENNKLNFGNDLSNFFVNSALKVFKPSKECLQHIVNFGINKEESVKLGRIRYSSADRDKNLLPTVYINPEDLVSQKTAIFGMTRTGKSNTVKIISKSVYQLRFNQKISYAGSKPVVQQSNRKIGQLIFDPNGEYANENLQDKSDVTGQAEALRNVWKIGMNGYVGLESDVETYGLTKNENDPKRNIMKLNFFDDQLMHITKNLINDALLSDGSNSNAQYIKSFCDVDFNFEILKDSISNGDNVRERRKRLIYKTLLANAGFKYPKNLKIKETGLFSKELIDRISSPVEEEFTDREETSIDSNLVANDDSKETISLEYVQCAKILRDLSNIGTTYDELGLAFDTLYKFMYDKNSGFRDFDLKYMETNGKAWKDVQTDSLLGMFKQKNALKKLGVGQALHEPIVNGQDYVKMIYDDLVAGKLVIIDQAFGDASLHKSTSERILNYLLKKNMNIFALGKAPPPVLIYVEEAHNLMPKGNESDALNIWAKVAKEGAKFNIGMVYSTQEVSGIQKNILKNTTNWFVAHLNNKEEVRVLSDYYDFEDFSNNILKAEDKGYLRMKTRSNRFVVPVQIDKFQVGN